MAGLLLICPMLDDRDATISGKQFAGVGVWDRESNLLGWRAYLGERPAGATVSPYAAPARANDLGGLPPTFIDVGSAETFRDEDVEFASRVWVAGGQAEFHVWADGFHSFETLVPQGRYNVDM